LAEPLRRALTRPGRPGRPTETNAPANNTTRSDFPRSDDLFARGEATGALPPRTWEATRIRLTAKRKYLVTDWEIAEFLEAEWRAVEEAEAGSWREKGPFMNPSSRS
jgi:hypothetical protein